MKIGYVRVSSVDQNEARQVVALKERGVEKLFVEKVSGKDLVNRKAIHEMVDYAREGDCIYIMDLSRLARNLKDLLDIIEILENKGVTFVSCKEALDTATPSGKLMLSMLGAIYEFERAIIRERQAEGINLAKQQGKYLGRRKVPKPENWDEVIGQYLNRKITAKAAMEQLKLKQNKFYQFLKVESSSGSKQSIGEGV